MDKECVYNSAKSINKADKLCEKGYLVINSKSDYSLPKYLEQWNCTCLNGFNFYVHPKQTLYYKVCNDTVFFLIGHAYNPFTGCISEEEIISEWISSERNGEKANKEYINSITGIFIMGKLMNDRISLILDCSGMMGGYYGIVKDIIAVSSHTVLFSELFSLETTEYFKKLTAYRFYSLYGSFLPGDITPYDNVYRILPNVEVSIDYTDLNPVLKRFYPSADIKKTKNAEEYELQIIKIADAMKKTMGLIAQKWKNPAISLTGGMDSKTTLSATNGFYDRFSYFSYITSEAEKIDANAAHKICDALQIEHKIYDISADPNDYTNYDIVKNILQFNKDYIGKNNTNDVCKRIFFDGIDDFDIEVKSWVSEIARANYYKKFGKKKMPERISPRRCSSMYKIFLHNRLLLHETDKVFEDYINKSDFESHVYNLDWSDLFLWEIRYGAWGGLVITSEHKYSFDITIPYNNRRILEMMLAVPLEKRRKDIFHNDLIKHMNGKIYDTGISVVNKNETKFRELCEKVYFNLNTFLPF